MTFNINEFKSTINRYGGNARTSLFEVTISGVPVSTGIISEGDLRFFCQSVSVPGINLDTVLHKASGFGFPESIPMSVQPDTLNTVFMLDSNHRVITFFHRWISSVMNIGGIRSDTSTGLPLHQIEYKNRYTASSLLVRHYSTHDPFRAYEYRYEGVYPTQVSPIELAWANKDTIATATINFSYSKMIYSGFTNNTFEKSLAFVGSQSSTARGGFAIAQTQVDTVAETILA